MKSKYAMAATLALAAFLGLAGCEGDDGRDGAAGPPGAVGPEGPEGPAGPPGESAATLPIETCSVCHSEGSFASAPAAHEVTGVPSVSNVTIAEVGPDLEISYTLEFDGVPAGDEFVEVPRAYVLRTADLSAADLSAVVTVAPDGGGDFTATIPDGVAQAGAGGRFVVIVGHGDALGAVSADYPVAIPNLVSDESCTSCHGPKGLTLHASHEIPGMEPSECIACHKAESGTFYATYITESWVGLIHGLHNAQNFPEGFYAYKDVQFDTTYPTYMTNCSVCHSEEQQLTVANTMPVTGPGCFSCHGSMDGFDFTGLEFHLTIPDPLTADCGSCHNGSLAGANVAAYHNGLTTERGGIIFNGVDTSVTEGAKIAWEIEGVVDDGETLEISWTASYDGTGVNPCNATAAAGAPVFFADGSGNLSILRSYAQGGDYILGTHPTNAGQPGSAPAVTTDNTTCSGNVATTVVPVEATDAVYGRVAIQGKPRLPSVLGGGELMAVRAFTPIYDWEIGSDVAAPERRAVVDSGLCLKCHVGSMYQHGGNRVDNVDMCYLCHNTAANDEFVRVGTYDVDASEAYDGRAGQNFGMKEMLHAVHSAGETGAPIVIYRGRGIYAWGESPDVLTNWPGSGRFPVAGSDDGAGNPVEQNHTFHTPTYPRLLNDCGACHVEGFDILPSAADAMASTVSTGADTGGQLDDVLEGAQTSTCVTCHRGDLDGVYNPSDEAAVKGHAYQNGWVPQAFPEGRKTIIDAL